MGPPVIEQGEEVEAWTEKAMEFELGLTLALHQDGVEYTELALDLPIVSYMAQSALPS